MTEEIINTDDYFYEITDEGRGTIGYGCVSYKTAELVRRIHKQNKQLKRLEQENKELKKQLSSTKCHLCGEGFLTPEGAELYEEKNNYRSALEEILKIVNQPCDNCKYNKDGITCSISDCGEGKLKIIETKINEVLE